MKIIIYGATEFGYLIANELYQANDITIIDKVINKTEEFNKLDISFVNGYATDMEVLKQANIKSADLFISCTPVDEANIVACITAKKISNVRTICFVAHEEYTHSFGESKDFLDSSSNPLIDSIIWPEELLTKEIFKITTVAKALDVENFANGRARLLEYKIEDGSPLINKSLKECKFPEGTIIVGVTRDSELFIPYGETVLKENDKVVFMGLSHSLDILTAKFFSKERSAKSIVVIGGGNVGLMLAKDLATIKAKIKVIEQDTFRCDYISQILSDTLIINGDGTNIEILTEEEIGEADVVVSVTDSDEKNLLCSLLAKQLGTPRVISRVSKLANIPLFEKVGIDIAISTKMAALHEIKSELSETDADIIASVEQGKGEVLEIVIPETFQERKLMELGMNVRAIVGIIHRQNRVIIPKGDTLIRVGDRLLIFTMHESVETVKNFF